MNIKNVKGGLLDGFFAKQFKISNMPIKMRMQCAVR